MMLTLFSAVENKMSFHHLINVVLTTFRQSCHYAVCGLQLTPRSRLGSSPLYKTLPFTRTFRYLLSQIRLSSLCRQ